jgi:anti-sigma factor RsiW
MTGARQDVCPRVDALSALIDGELEDPARIEVTAHAEGCPLCGAMLRDMTELSAAMRPFATARAGFDLMPLIEPRLPARGKSRRTPAGGRSWWQRWQLLPSGLAAAAVLMTGTYLGALLAGGAGVTAMRPAAMAMFDPIPPGGLCAGLPSCYPLGR